MTTSPILGLCSKILRRKWQFWTPFSLGSLDLLPATFRESTLRPDSCPFILIPGGSLRLEFVCFWQGLPLLAFFICSIVIHSSALKFTSGLQCQVCFYWCLVPFSPPTAKLLHSSVLPPWAILFKMHPVTLHCWGVYTNSRQEETVFSAPRAISKLHHSCIFLSMPPIFSQQQSNVKSNLTFVAMP